MRRIALNSVKMNGTLVYNSGQQLTGWSFITVEQFHLQFPRNFFVYYSAAMAKIVDSVVTGSFSYASPPHRSLETSVLNYANVLIKEVIRGNQIGRAIALCRQILSLSFLPSSLDIYIWNYCTQESLWPTMRTKSTFCTFVLLPLLVQSIVAKRGYLSE